MSLSVTGNTCGIAYRSLIQGEMMWQANVPAARRQSSHRERKQVPSRRHAPTR